MKAKGPLWQPMQRFSSTVVKAEKNLERSAPDLNFKNCNDQNFVKLSTSTALLHQSQDPDWNEVGI